MQIPNRKLLKKSPPKPPGSTGLKIYPAGSSLRLNLRLSPAGAWNARDRDSGEHGFGTFGAYRCEKTLFDENHLIHWTIHTPTMVSGGANGKECGVMKKHFFHLFLILTVLALLPVSSMAGSAILNWQPNSESDLDGYRVYYGTSSRSYGPPLYVNTATTCTLDTLSEGATYYFAVTAYDTSGNESGFSAEVHKSFNAPDTSAPTVLLSSPTSGGSYTTESASMMVTGTATDNVGVTQVAWSNDRGGSGTAPIDDNGSWTVGNIALYEGPNNLTFEARDAAGNQGSRSLTVTYTAPVQASSDQVAPTVRIVSPTSKSSYFSRVRSIDLAGTALDNIKVAKITWQNSRGETGTAAGTLNWAVAGIPLNRWNNTITITAHDAAGNSSSASLTVFCWR
jgi:hypothetical protein